MSDLSSAEVSAAILEMRDLLRLIAEPAIAQRDQKQRENLKSVVGRSPQKISAVALMDGTKSQAEIHRLVGIKKGNLSVFVKQLNEAGLLSSRSELPKLNLTIPPDFFEGE
jgi:hypothetical protein